MLWGSRLREGRTCFIKSVSTRPTQLFITNTRIEKSRNFSQTGGFIATLWRSLKNFFINNASKNLYSWQKIVIKICAPCLHNGGSYLSHGRIHDYGDERKTESRRIGGFCCKLFSWNTSEKKPAGRKRNEQFQDWLLPLQRVEWRSIKLSYKINEKFDVDTGSDDEWSLFVFVISPITRQRTDRKFYR